MQSLCAVAASEGTGGGMVYSYCNLLLMIISFEPCGLGS